jgi:hypothetical protein
MEMKLQIILSQVDKSEIDRIVSNSIEHFKTMLFDEGYIEKAIDCLEHSFSEDENVHDGITETVESYFIESIKAKLEN